MKDLCWKMIDRALCKRRFTRQMPSTKYAPLTENDKKHLIANAVILSTIAMLCQKKKEREGRKNIISDSKTPKTPTEQSVNWTRSLISAVSLEPLLLQLWR